MPALEKVSVVILSWNGRKHLEHCLPALREQEEPGVPWEVLVLDNGSHDGTVEWLRREHPEVELIESKVNLGFCGGNNRLVDEANGDAVVLLNNDTRPRPDWLRHLVAAYRAADDDVAAISGCIVDWEGERLDFARGAITFDGHAFQLGYRRPLDEVELPEAGTELPFACGGNMMIRRSSYLDAGGFDEDYFAYLEDVDLGWRLWSGGERVTFAPDAVVHHRSMATSAMLGNANRGFLFERNAFLTAYKNYDDEHLERLLPAILLTLTHRTQTLLVQNNPGGEQLTFDPYRGMIANTAAVIPVKEPKPESDGVEQDLVEEESVEEDRVEPDSTEASTQEVVAPGPKSPTLLEKWRGYGPSDFFRRGVRKAMRLVTPAWLWDERPAWETRVVDDRTVAQLRAVTQLLGNLDEATEKRRAVQARRKRSDREILERFPLYVVPTYPGDERLFQSAAFQAWLSSEVPVVEAALDEVMETQ